MNKKIAGAFFLAFLASSAMAGPGRAQTPLQKIKIGVLTDMAGPASDATGPGAVIAARLAVEDYAKAIFGDVSVEVIQADHQNKPDLASSIARQWIDVEGVNVITEVTNSSAALAVNEIVRNSGKAVFLPSGAGTTDLTGSKCSTNTVHWTYDTYAVSNATAKAVTRLGNKDWFLVTADYAFGHSLEEHARRTIQQGGGKVLGTIRHPYAVSDMSSFVLQAQASKAKVIGLANSVVDTVNFVKEAKQFGIMDGGQQVAALIMLITDVHALGLEAAQGLQLTSAFYWDMNEETRAFAKKFADLAGGKRPTMLQAGVYSSLIHYMKAVKALGNTDGKTVVEKMKELPTDDPLFGKGSIRADGRKIHDVYLFQVKSPSESKGPWDYYKLLATIPGNEAFRPIADGGCPLVKN